MKLNPFIEQPTFDTKNEFSAKSLEMIIKHNPQIKDINNLLAVQLLNVTYMVLCRRTEISDSENKTRPKQKQMIHTTV